MTSAFSLSTPSRSARSTPYRVLSFALATAATLTATLASPAFAQINPDQTAAGTNRALKLAPDSPFRGPDVIYLEADELINDEAANLLTAIGEVEGRYQDRTLRANRVEYDLNTGLILAIGDVVLIDATGDVQYADKLELSDELQAGTAANFTARLATGAITAARFVTRDDDGEFEFFNVTYTACEPCKNSEGETKNPTWRLWARRVKQDAESRTIRYNDAVLELFGLPIFYTPYLAHPDPSQDRASGLLIPTIGNSGSRGFTTVLPYYWAIDDYSEATITPHIYSKVNPLLKVEARRKFHTGKINFAGSVTHGTLFDRNGEPLDDPNRFRFAGDAEMGAETSSHFFIDGYFKPSNVWSYGYTVMLQTDDTYLRRYDLDTTFKTNGLIENEPLRNTTQAFLAGQEDNFRISAVALGFQNLRSRYREDETTGLISVSRDENKVVPIIAPRVQGEYYTYDPALGGRIRLFGNASYLTRDTGSDYGRATAGAEYSKTWIAPGGIEIKPFVWSRFDNYDIESDAGTKIVFSRTIGQAGVDLRYPFIRRSTSVDLIIEPRALYTESFGDAKLDEFFDSADGSLLIEDGNSSDLDAALLFEPNKANGYDFFEEGRRVDLGARFAARWDMAGRSSEAAIFAGRSFSDGTTNRFAAQSGLSSGSSEYIAELDLNLGGFFKSNSWVRYDEDRDVFSRIDSRVSLNTKFLSLSGRYYTLNLPTLTVIPGTPQEEISGGIVIRPFDGWSLGYNAVHDFDRDVSRTQRATLGYKDDCTLVEIYFQRQDFDNDVIRNNNTLGIRLTLATLGNLGSN